MHKYIILIRLIVLLNICLIGTGHSASVCKLKAAQIEAQKVIPWKTDHSSLFVAFRTNAAYFWNQLSKAQHKNLRTVLKHKGIVIGDMHPGNIADLELKKSGRRIGVVDLDDVGFGSVFGDFMRLMTASKIAHPLSVKKAIGFYLDGYSGNAAPKAAKIQERLNRNKAEFDEKQIEFNSKYYFGDKFRHDTGLTPVESAPQIGQTMFREFQALLPTLFKSETILDTAIRIKSSGGSRGLPRVWVLTKDQSNQKHVYEIKTPPKGALENVSTQLSFVERVKYAERFYQPDSALDVRLEAIEVNGNGYIIRERYDQMLKLEITKMKSRWGDSDITESIYYLFHWLGQQHRRQNLDLQYEIDLRQNQKELVEGIEDWISDFISLIKYENK